MDTVGACRHCRKDLAHWACCRGGIVRRSGRLRRRPDGLDLISALLEDLILQVLARLRCAHAAAHTSLLSRRWRGLWTRLPEFSFHRISPDQLHAALAQVACPAPSLLDIRVCHHDSLESARISSLLRAAATLAPEKIHVGVGIEPSGNAIELPCFPRTISISLDVSYGRIALPSAGGFPALESLSLSSCRIELADILPLCPRLRKLRIHDHEFQSITVHSPSLEELDVYTRNLLQHVDILAPLLKKLRFDAGWLGYRQ